MKRIFLMLAATVVGSFLSSCADIGGGDPLDGPPTSDGGTLYVREMPQ